jgi:hypothetical protein
MSKSSFQTWRRSILLSKNHTLLRSNTPCGDAIRSAKHIIAADGGDAIRKLGGYAGRAAG